MAKLFVVLAFLVSFVIAESTGCVCTEEWAPVCGKDGVTYGNTCGADCAGVAVAYPGHCAQKAAACPCPFIYAPVCGDDGKLYSSACVARCAGVPVVNSVACLANKMSAPCPLNYAPVCGWNGQVYSNECMCLAAGTWVFDDLTENALDVTGATDPNTALTEHCIDLLVAYYVKRN